MIASFVVTQSGSGTVRTQICVFEIVRESRPSSISLVMI